MNEVVIEEVRDLDADWPELKALYAELQAYHFPLTQREFVYDWQERLRAHLASAAESLILVARSGGEAIGFITAGVNRSPALFNETFGYVGDAYVRPEARSLGVGQTMLAQVEAWCQTCGVDELRLSVVAANKLGVRFWTKAGFELQSMTMRKAL
jgi:ribosomal protein S18 acetylase RimI-like enzyme